MGDNDRQNDGMIAGAAEALSRALQATAQWQAWREADIAFASNEQVRNLVERYQTLAGRWRSAQARGSGLMGRDAIELAEVQDKLQRHPLVVRLQEANENLHAIFEETNRVMTAFLGIDFAATAAVRRGGCCG